MRAYRKNYLSGAADKLGTMMDYAVNDCEFDGDVFLHMFIKSGLAQKFETDKHKTIAAMSGTELAAEAIKYATGKPPSVIPAHTGHRTAEYWAGWVLAHYQWHTAKSIASIIRYLPFGEIVEMHDRLREADITEFYKTADDIISDKCPKTNLKRLRESKELTQAELSKKADIPLQTIQMYEERQKDINKAQACTLLKAAHALDCAIEDLME